MNDIATKMRELRLPSMAQCWQSLAETRRADSLTLSDGLEILLQAERDGRLANRNARLLRNAKFRYQTTVQEMIFDTARGLDKNKIMTLSTCEYIRKGLPVIITGPTGTGKSSLASALGYQACLSGMSTRYFGMQKFFEQMHLARIDATVNKLMERLVALDLLILDDFGMQVLDNRQILDLMEVLEDRHGRKSTIIVSQLPVSQWYSILEANTTAADAILDRIVHTAYRFELKGESLRKNR